MDEKHGQGTHSTHMGADKSAKSIPNAPKYICPNCLPHNALISVELMVLSMDSGTVE